MLILSGFHRAGLALALMALTLPALPVQADMKSRTTKFEGVKANTGYATAMKEGAGLVLTLSDDFKVPDAPAPHWQVVDSMGNTYLLQRLVVKEEKFHKMIVVPAYVKDVVKVQIWCAWAEVLLGEASFDKPVK